MPEQHELIGGKIKVYRRGNGTHWHCSTYMEGKNWRVSTKLESLAHAKDFAEDWFLDLKGKKRAGELQVGKTFNQAAEQFLKEADAIIAPERSPYYVAYHKLRLDVHLRPFFGKKTVSEITPGMVQEYRIHRMTSRKRPGSDEPVRPSRGTLHHEIVTLRHVLNTAYRHGWINFVPMISAPFKASSKISHRGWFSQDEYRQLYQATRRRAAKPNNVNRKWACEQLHDYVLFMANTGLRPDEAARLEFRDVSIVVDKDTSDTILEIEVRGKRGFGYCKSTPNAVRPFERLRDRLRKKDSGVLVDGRRVNITPTPDWKKPAPTDRIFPKSHYDLLKVILEEEGLKTDREGQPRMAYSLRHTYICFRLLEGADIYQIAKNCRTTVEMIEKFYASHLKNSIDTAAVNRMKPRAKKGASREEADEG